MPRYKYSCLTCNLQDVKKFVYKSDNQWSEQKPVCKECGEVLQRNFLKPPQEWMNQQRRT